MTFSQALSTRVLIGIAVLLGIIGIAIASFDLFYSKKASEKYTSSAIQNIGGLSDYGRDFKGNFNYKHSNYDTMNQYNSQYNPFFPYKNTENFTVDGVKMNGRSPYEPIGQLSDPHINTTANKKKTVDRLDRIDPTIVPITSNNVTPYNLDVADPTTYTYQVHAPRVIRKDKLAMQADPFRGDIPISIFPDVPIIHKSQYDRDSLRLDGMFSEALSKSYDRLTGKNQFNKPMMVSQQGLVMDM